MRFTMSSEGGLDLAVIIVEYNTRDELDACLRSIAGSHCQYRCEVIVVDNHSTDGSLEMVRKQHEWVHHAVRAERNGGYAYANNLGLRYAGFPNATAPRYALLLNPDTVLPPDALERAVSYMDAHPEVGVLGPKLIRRNGSLDKACRRGFPTPRVSFYHMVHLDRLFPCNPRFARYNLTYLDPDLPAEVDAVVGAFMLIRREALQQVGLLDESFFMYGEDLDLCYRIKKAGWQVVYWPGVTVLHVKGASSRKASATAIPAFYDAMRIFHAKHYRDETFFLLNWLIEAGIALLRWQAILQDRLRPRERKRVASA